MRVALRALAVFSAMATVPAIARADALSDFYKGRNLTISVGSAAGSGFTLYARLISRHMPKYIH